MNEAQAEGVKRAILAGGYPDDVNVIEDASAKDLTTAKGAVIATVDAKLAIECQHAGWGVIGTVGGSVVHSDGSKSLTAAKAPSARGKKRK